MEKIFTLSLLLISLFSIAQKNELGKVTIEELSQKNHPTETSAEAAILYSKGETHFEYSQNDGFFIITDVETKIKIYNKDGYNWANFSVELYNSSDGQEFVNFTKAVTYNLVNGVIEKTKLKSENEFKETVDKNRTKRKISMPNVKEGSIIEYKYTITSPFYFKLPRWDFQKSIPVDYSEYQTSVPEYYFYNPHIKGYIQPYVTKEKKNKTIDYQNREITRVGTISNPNSIVKYKTINYDDIVNNYKITKIPSLKDESFVNNIENYSASVEHELSGKRFPDEIYKSYSTTWEAVAKQIYNNDNFGSELNKTNYFETEITNLIKDLKNDNEKINIIFEFVQKRMNWNDYKGYRCDVGVKEAFKTKTGNAAEINLMLTSMLRFAGLEANPIILSTRDHGINLFPSSTGFNYVIAGVEIGEKVILLDATNKFSLPNVLPLRDLNWSGRLIKKDGTSLEIDLLPNILSQETSYVFANIEPNGTLTGKQRNQYFDYFAYRFRNNFNITTNDKYLEYLESYYKNIEFDNYEKLPDTDYKSPIIENFSFTSTNYVENLGGKLYFSPLLYLAETTNPFKQETREYPIDFNFPKIEKINLNIKIPENYIVDSLPESSVFKMENDYATFSMQIELNENQIQVQLTKTINTSIIGADEYVNLKNYFKMMVEKESQKIILKKKV